MPPLLVNTLLSILVLQKQAQHVSDCDININQCLVCGRHNPLTPRSGIRVETPLISSVPLTTGSLTSTLPLLQYLQCFPNFTMPLCYQSTPLVVKACPKLKAATRPSQTAGIHKQRSAVMQFQNMIIFNAERSKWWQTIGRTVSQLEACPSIVSMIIHLFIGFMESRTAVSSFTWSKTSFALCSSISIAYR